MGRRLVCQLIIGNGAVIGSNAVVINDVPSNSVAAGIPVKNIQR